MNITDALTGSAGLEGVRWILLGGAPRRALRRELRALMSAPSMLGGCRLRRARFKPSHKLIACYDTNIRGEGDAKVGIRPIVVTWGSQKDRGRCEGTAGRADMEAEALRRGVSAPFWKLAADTRRLRMHVRVWPLDMSFPQLVRVCDPQYVGTMVAGAYAARDRAPDHAPIGRYAVTPIRYRPGQRHVLRYDSVHAPERGAIFAKLYSTSEDGERIFRLAKQIAEWLALNGEGVTSVQPLCYVAEDAVALYPQVLGTPLSERLRRPCQKVGRPLKNTGAALFVLHQLPLGIVGPLKLRDFTAEVEQIARGSEHVCALLPGVGATLKALLDRARELYERLPLEPPAFAHGDFKAEHVWVTPDGLRLIDFDRCHAGDPALDIGKCLADLRFRCTVNGEHELKQAREQFLAGYGPGAPAERMKRACLYEVIEFVKETVRRVGMFERDWARRTDRLIHSAQAMLDDLQSTLGLPAKRSLSARYPVMSSALRPMRGGWHRRPSPSGGSG